MPSSKLQDPDPDPEVPSSTTTLLSSFPKSVEEFHTDLRVSFSKLDGKWLLEADNGLEFEWDGGLERWLPIMDDELLKQQSKIYAVPGVDESEPAGPKRKLKAVYTNGEEENGGRLERKKAKPLKDAPVRKNTAVYVTNLPPNTTVEEVHAVFSRCGVIAEEIDGRRPRIKLYTAPDGTFKGDALVVYFRAESVDLAVQMLDESELRFGEPGKMHVQAADFSYKKQGQSGDAAPKTNLKDKKKIIKKIQKLNSKLADWDDDDPGTTLGSTRSKWDRLVILKHMFTLEELAADPAAILEIKDEIRQECAKCGEVTNVVLFDLEKDGVASVRFTDEDAALACVRMIDGRAFATRRVEAYIADGTEKFSKTSEKKALPGDDDGEESKRLEQFGSWLEEGEKRAE